MLKAQDDFYDQIEEPNKGCLLALREIILAQDSNITETKKYGMPCFCWKKKHFCYLWVDKKTSHPYILFVEGKLINHPLLVQGSRSRMKVFMVDPGEDVPLKIITELINEAITLCR